MMVLLKYYLNKLWIKILEWVLNIDDNISYYKKRLFNRKIDKLSIIPIIDKIIPYIDARGNMPKDVYHILEMISFKIDEGVDKNGVEGVRFYIDLPLYYIYFFFFDFFPISFMNEKEGRTFLGTNDYIIMIPAVIEKGIKLYKTGDSLRYLKLRLEKKSFANKIPVGMTYTSWMDILDNIYYYLEFLVNNFDECLDLVKTKDSVYVERLKLGYKNLLEYIDYII